jgi:hypothetical protein
LLLAVVVLLARAILTGLSIVNMRRLLWPVVDSVLVVLLLLLLDHLLLAVSVRLSCLVLSWDGVLVLALVSKQHRRSRVCRCGRRKHCRLSVAITLHDHHLGALVSQIGSRSFDNRQLNHWF